MVIHDSGGNHPEKPRESFISRYLFSTDHKTIGLQYLWLALLSVFVGMAMSLVMRIHLAWPEMHIPFLSALGSSPERYATLPVLHGSLMVFLVLTAAPQLGLAFRRADRKSTRLNSSHVAISYAVFCLKKKK